MQDSQSKIEKPICGGLVVAHEKLNTTQVVPFSGKICHASWSGLRTSLCLATSWMPIKYSSETILYGVCYPILPFRKRLLAPIPVMRAAWCTGFGILDCRSLQTFMAQKLQDHYKKSKIQYHYRLFFFLNTHISIWPCMRVALNLSLLKDHQRGLHSVSS
jgi:hypothetical protein